MNVQQTIQQPVEFRGTGLHSGTEAILRLFPSGVNTGIWFVRKDRAGYPKVRADVMSVQEIQRRTAIVSGSAEIHTVEHLMAALYACAITNLLVEIEGDEVPGLDGSALPFYLGIQQAGIVKQSEKAVEFCLKEPLTLTERNVTVEAYPCADGLRLTYQLQYPYSWFADQEYSILLTQESFAREIASARTFVLEPEVELLKKAGLGKGATLQNTLVFNERGIIQNTLRFPDECVRHKILDLIGDLSLLNVRLKAHIVAKRSGHQANFKLALKIREVMKSLQLVS
ncbi:MAG: UDP-3-O-acyl-N-acetylglucosamine deacetylase [Planctomycetota bacterium]|mgnify:CR=1 FL=1